MNIHPIASITSKALLMLALIITVLHGLSAETFSNKTYSTPRPVATFLPYDASALQSLTHQWAREKKPHYIVRVTPYIGWSNNRNALAHYFLFDEKDSLQVGAAGPCIDIDHRYLAFDETSPCKLTGTMYLAPHVTSAGALIQYFQRLSASQNGFFYTVMLPIEHRVHHTGFCVQNDIAASSGAGDVKTYFYGAPMFQFTSSTAGGSSTVNLQEPLIYGKIAPKRTKTGVADLYLDFGYQCLAKRHAGFSFCGELIFPTTRTSRACNLFEVRMGYGGHWALGLRSEGYLTLWRDRNHTRAPHDLQIQLQLRWNYIFPANEKRTLGLNNTRCYQLNFGQYMLLGVRGNHTVVPAANVLTQRVKIKPRNEFEGLVGLMYHRTNVTINLGYDFWTKQAEKIKLLDCWNDCLYAMPGSDYAQDIVEFTNSNQTIAERAAFTVAQSNISNTINRMNPRGIPGTITQAQLNLDAARSDEALTHTFYGTVSYRWCEWGNVLITELGGAYEITTNNAALNMARIWASATMVF